jgi:hypothetical protein
MTATCSSCGTDYASYREDIGEYLCDDCHGSNLSDFGA